MTPTPDTVTEAVAFLVSEGYDDELSLTRGALTCRHVEGTQPIDDAVVDYTFRFEGPSDPADEAIVLGVTCPAWGIKGVVVAAFGPDIDPADAALLSALAARARP